MKRGADMIALSLLCLFFFFPKWKRKGRDSLLVYTLFYLYLSTVVYFTLSPVLTSIPFLLNHPYRPMNLIPFIDVWMGRGDFLRQIGLNVVMTAPFGFLFPLTQRAQNKTASFGKTAVCCFLMSLGIELLQPLINGSRSSDITDILANTAGGMLGYGCYALLRPVIFWFLNRLEPKDET